MQLAPHFLNPFSSPIVVPFLWRLGLLYGLAIITMLIIKKGNLSAVWESNIGRRIVGWLILTPLYFIGTFAGGIPGLLVLLLFISGAVIEFAHIAQLDRKFRFALLLLTVISLFIVGFMPKYFYSLPLIYFLIITPLAIRLNKPDKSFEQAAFSIYACIWLIFSLCHIVLLTRLGSRFDNTHALTFLVIFAVALADIGGYVFGKMFHEFKIFDMYKVADKLSPNKTYVGILGYIVGALIAIAIFHFAVGRYMSSWQWLSVGTIIGIFAFVGGLTHSYFKRYFGVKDSGNIIPGHGGVMDRIDSIARVSVILYYFLIIFVL